MTIFRHIIAQFAGDAANGRVSYPLPRVISILLWPSGDDIWSTSSLRFLVSCVTKSSLSRLSRLSKLLIGICTGSSPDR